MKDIIVATKHENSLPDFLNLHDFEIEDLGNDVLKVVRADEMPVFVKVGDEVVYFEVDLGSLSHIGSSELYFQLLDANTEILPVSFGISTADPEDPRLVLVESRISGDLSDQEVLSVFDALELAADHAESILKNFIS